MSTQAEALEHLAEKVGELTTSVDVHIALTKNTHAQFRKELDDVQIVLKELVAAKNRGVGYIFGVAAVASAAGISLKEFAMRIMP